MTVTTQAATPLASAPTAHAADRQPAPAADSTDEGLSYAALLLTTLTCFVFAVGGHAVLWWAFVHAGDSPPVPYQPVVGISLAAVAVVSFGGYYAASRRARIGIGAGFLLTFLVLLTYILTIEALGDATQAAGAREVFADFRWVVVTIVGFYFGGETITGVTKVRAVARTPEAAADVRRADRDLVPSGGSA